MTAGDLLVRNAADHRSKDSRQRSPEPDGKKKITSIVVVDPASQKVVGVVHLHDLWTLELM